MPDRLYNEDAVTDSAKFHDSKVSFVSFKTLPHIQGPRVLELVLIDINYPRDGNPVGILLTRLWVSLGDIVRDLEPLFRAFDFAFSEREIGGWGSVHLYLAKKRQVSDGR